MCAAKVILANDVSNIYEVPLAYHEQGLDTEICRHFGLEDKAPDLSRWQDINHAINPEGEVKSPLWEICLTARFHKR